VEALRVVWSSLGPWWPAAAGPLVVSA